MPDYISGITHCTFTCKDYAAMEKFYGETLGLPKLFKIDFDQKTIDNFLQNGYKDLKVRPGDEWLSYYKVASQQFIELFNVPYNGENDTEDEGFHHVCFMVEDIEEAARDLEAKGVKLWHGPKWLENPYDAPYTKEPGQCGSLAFYIQDPEGNEIEIMQFTENSLQVIHDHD